MGLGSGLGQNYPSPSAIQSVLAAHVERPAVRAANFHTVKGMAACSIPGRANPNGRSPPLGRCLAGAEEQQSENKSRRCAHQLSSDRIPPTRSTTATAAAASRNGAARPTPALGSQRAMS